MAVNIDTEQRLFELQTLQTVLDTVADQKTQETRVFPGEIRDIASVAEGVDIVIIGAHPYRTRLQFGDRLLTTGGTRQNVLGVRETIIGFKKVELITPFPYSEDLKAHPLAGRIAETLQRLVPAKLNSRIH